MVRRYGQADVPREVSSRGGPAVRPAAADFPRDVCLTVSRNHAVFLLYHTHSPTKVFQTAWSVHAIPFAFTLQYRTYNSEDLYSYYLSQNQFNQTILQLPVFNNYINNLTQDCGNSTIDGNRVVFLGIAIFETILQLSPLYTDSKVHGAHLGHVGPRWAPCQPHEPCYQGNHNVITMLPYSHNGNIYTGKTRAFVLK